MQDINSDSIGMRINYLDNSASTKLSEFISKYIEKETLIICIGTDKCIGDSLGPIVGTFLKKNNFPHPVIGTLENPAHAINLETIIKGIKAKYPEYFIIAVDACLGYEECIGDIQIKIGPVHPGKGVGKTLPHIGNISIVGVVDTIDNSDMFSIRNTRLNFIMKMADVIVETLVLAADKNVIKEEQ